jgi:hypothetical protein
MKGSTHRTQIYLTRDQYTFLCNQAEKRGASIAGIVRELIDEKIPKEKDYENNPLFTVGKDGFRMGRRKGSLNHDEYLYGGKR